MATNVSQQGRNVGRTRVTTGKQILDIITSGMYSNSLMVIREYVQNAADALDEAVQAGLITPQEGRIDVRFAGSDRSISICDNGVGVPSDRVAAVLCGVGISRKTPGGSRGFRGIGRLGGIGYSDKVVFETRSSRAEPVSVVTWDAERLRAECRSNETLVDAGHVIGTVVSVARRPARLDEEEHFFRVTMQAVHRFHRDDLMNVNAVREYLGRVAPVPFRHDDFPPAQMIEHHLASIDGYKTYILSVDGQPVYRPHTQEFSVSGQSFDRIGSIELIDVRGHEGQSIGRGWYARLNYIASIPPRVGMRGIRVRQGNIEVGDEYFLADFFAERRFATWHIGEIHLNYSLKINARRDGFEQSPDFEAFIEQAGLLGRHLSYLCRAASKARSRRLGATQMLVRAESIVHGAFFLTEEHLHSALAGAEAMLSEVEHSLHGTEDFGGIQERIAQDREAIGRLRKTTPLLHTILDGRSLRHMGHKELITSIAQGVLEQHSKHRSPESLIRAVLHPYIKSSHLGTK